jgi:hypothetical protein
VLVLDEVTVALSDLDTERLWGRSIDLAAPARRSEAYWLDLAGWVLGQTAPALDVEVIYEGTVVHRAPVRRPRADIAAAYPDVPYADRSGFTAGLSVPGTASILELQVRAVLKDQSRPAIAVIRARRRWQDSDPGAVPSSMTGKWNLKYTAQSSYGDDTTYRKGMAFLDGHGTIEDWGCGKGHARHFVNKSQYVGIDGSWSPFSDKIVDLENYRSSPDCIFMRHVLEHNHNWRRVLENAVNSFMKRMTLIIFTPFEDETRQISTNWSDVPDIAFRKEDLLEYFRHLLYREETIHTDTQYGIEHIFYLKK